MSSFKKLSFYLFIIGFFCALLVLNNRRIYEKRNKSVETILDFQEILQYISLNNISFEEFLKEAKKLDIISFAVPEITLADLAESKVVCVDSISELSQREYNALDRGIPPCSTLIRIPKSKDAEKLYKILKYYFPSITRLRRSLYPSQSLFIVPLIKEEALKLPLGILNVPDNDFQSKINIIIKKGFYIIPRIVYTPYDTSMSISERVKDVSLIRGVKTIMFYGDRVAGYPHLKEDLYKAIKRTNLKVGVIEFIKQEGIDDVVKNLSKRAIMVHSISDKEMVLFEPVKNSRRFLRAVKERNIRLIYLRIFRELPIGISWKENLSYLNSIIGGLKKEKFVIASASLPINFHQNYILNVLVFLGGISFVFFIIHNTVSNKLNNIIEVIIILFAGVIFILLKDIILLQITSLFIAITIPILSVNAIYMNENVFNKVTKNINLNIALLLWTEITLINIMAGIFIGALLSRREFFVKVEAFRGVKFALVIPIIFAMYLYFSNVRKVKIYNLLKREFHFYDAFVWVFAIAVFLILLIRSGNPSILPTLSIEEFMRNKLEIIFSIRPRTKEFLIGHPLLILAVIPFFSKKMYPFLVCVGFIGQISLINSFCHIHTPIVLTFIRTFTGIGLGGIIGIFCWIILTNLCKWRKLYEKVFR